jgi:hypothetical protein
MWMVMQYKTISNLLVICIALVTGGCADDLDRAYQNGNLSAAEYYQLKSERAAQRQAIIQQNLAIQQQQIQDNQNSLARTANNLELQQAQQASHPFVFPALPPSQPIMPNVGLMSQQQPSLPAASDMATSFQTGNTRFGPDGRMWHEYRTSSGTTYWKLDQ